MNLRTLFLKVSVYFSSHSFARRCVSTVFLISLLFCSVYFGGVYGAIGLMTLVSVLALYEFYKLAEHMGGRPRTVMGLVLGAALPILLFYSAETDPEEARRSVPALLGVAGAIFALGLLLLAKRKIPAWAKAFSTVFGLLYIPLAVSFYALLAGIFGMDGVWLCVWIVLAAKFTDIGGLVIGCRFGKRKLAPNVSPNKTWEGVAGGVVFSVLGSAGLAWALGHFGAWSASFPGFSPLLSALCAVPVAGTSVVSDLVESAFKRIAGDKDSGATIPGIGGALDLLDSLIFVAPVGYALAEFCIFS